MVLASLVSSDLDISGWRNFCPTSMNTFPTSVALISGYHIVTMINTFPSPPLTVQSRTWTFKTLVHGQFINELRRNRNLNRRPSTCRSNLRRKRSMPQFVSNFRQQNVEQNGNHHENERRPQQRHIQQIQQSVYDHGQEQRKEHKLRCWRHQALRPFSIQSELILQRLLHTSYRVRFIRVRSMASILVAQYSRALVWELVGHMKCARQIVRSNQAVQLNEALPIPALTRSQRHSLSGFS